MIDGIEELKARIVATLDVVEFLDILGLDMADIVEVLEEEIEENAVRLTRACQ